MSNICTFFSGHFAITKKHDDYDGPYAILWKDGLKLTYPQCSIEFYYYYYNSNESCSLSVEFTFGQHTALVKMLILRANAQWRKVHVPVGQLRGTCNST